MIPVEYTAGGTAFVFHDKAEGTPYKHTYEVTNIEKNTYHKQVEL